ncbi:hypothetical protein Pan54_19690 [Rubinisphaera italica]|uniref:Uncharacterized protein n=1 Tax=Rubinisphaera italica TaxID=2527969 RepID=A0A5C5XEL5_9PLAN|nr:hypothetical protein Pan54_19690 [Rubinisphaera italica]
MSVDLDLYVRKHGDFLEMPYDVWKIKCSSALQK